MQFAGLKLPKTRSRLVYCPKAKSSNAESRANGASTSKDITTNMAMTSSNKGHGNSDDINLVTLRNSFAALNEDDKLFENVDTSNVGNDGSTVKEATKVVKDSDKVILRTYTTRLLNSWLHHQNELVKVQTMKVHSRMKIMIFMTVMRMKFLI